jgi:GAF domain-containing protein
MPMNQQKMQPRTQLRLRLERPTAEPPLTSDSQELLEALADLLLGALDRSVLKLSVKEGGDES